MKISKQAIKKLASICLASSMLLLVGCGSSSTSPVPSTDLDATQPPTTSSSIVRTSINSDPDFLDPHLSAAADTKTMMNNVFEGLMGVDASGEFIPVLATDYAVSDDGLIYTFTLKDNVVFHNEQPMTVDDVIYSYKRLAGLNGEEALSSKFASVTSIDQLDEATIQFTLSEPSSSFLSACTEAVIPANSTDLNTNPVGTGPFKFANYTPGMSLTLTAFPNYHTPSTTNGIESVEFVIMPDPSSTLLALKAGDLDIAQIDSINAEILKNEFEIISYPQNMVQVFALNHKVAPFDDVRVRQALNYAIDQDLIINGVVNGYGTKVYSHGSPVAKFWTNDFDGVDPYPYDMEKAKALLTEAGYPTGFETTIKVPSNYQTHIDTAQVIADMLSKVGVTLNIELVEWGQWLEQVYTNRDYETTIVALTGKPDPHDTYIRYTSDYPKNFYNYTSAEYDALVAKANVEGDEMARATLYKEAQAMLTEDAAAVYIMDPHLILGAVKNLDGFTPYPYQFFDASKLFYTQD